MEGTQSWTNEFKDSFKDLRELYHFLDWPQKVVLEEVSKKYPIFIPKSLALKIKDQGPDGVLAREFLPHSDELLEQGFDDPIGDKNFFKAPQLIHRYYSRVLFTPTTVCPVHCRYCFRKNELNSPEEIFQQDFEQTLKYLNDHPEISEVIFTGGDPLTLSNQRLEKYLRSFAQIKSIKDIRFHSRYPVILPSRLDEEFSSLLTWASSNFRTVTLAIHANHISEFDEANRKAIQELHRSGVQLLSQTVLLKGVNDDSQTLIDLFEHFLDLKIRPYYLHHPDQVKGGLHFYLSLETGRKIYQTLRDKLPGWALPHYVIDIPEGHGKVTAYNPEATTFSGQLITRTGEKRTLQEPDFFN